MASQELTLHSDIEFLTNLSLAHLTSLTRLILVEAAELAFTKGVLHGRHRAMEWQHHEDAVPVGWQQCAAAVAWTDCPADMHGLLSVKWSAQPDRVCVLEKS